MIRNVSLRVAPKVPLFTGDIGIGAARRVRATDGQRRLIISLSVSDLGDLRTYSGVFEVDGTGKVLAPAVAGAVVGAAIDLSQVTGTIQTGTAADLMLLERDRSGYRVVRLFSALQEVR